MKVLLKDIVDVRHSFEYYNGDSSQILIINLPNTLKIKLTVAHNVFEWFVDIYNSQGILLISNWYDHYDNSYDTLIKEMQESITQFVSNITENKTRVIVEKRFLNQKTIFQVFRNDIWVELFKTSKLKL